MHCSLLKIWKACSPFTGKHVFTTARLWSRAWCDCTHSCTFSWPHLVCVFILALSFSGERLLIITQHSLQCLRSRVSVCDAFRGGSHYIANIEYVLTDSLKPTDGQPWQSHRHQLLNKWGRWTWQHRWCQWTRQLLSPLGGLGEGLTWMV